MDGEKTRDTRPLLIGPPEQMTRSLGRHHDDVYLLRRSNFTEMDIESMSEGQSVTRLEVGLNRIGVDTAHDLIWHKHHDHVCPCRGFVRGEDSQSPLLRRCSAGRLLSETDNHLDTRILEIEGVCMSLASVADDRHFLVLDQAEVAVLVVVDRRHHMIVGRIFAASKTEP